MFSALKRLRYDFSAKLLALVHPFAAIANELRIIRELYELDLGSRTDHLGRPVPIYRITEAPSKKDTQVTYGELPEKESLWEEALDDMEDGE